MSHVEISHKLESVNRKPNKLIRVKSIKTFKYRNMFFKSPNNSRRSNSQNPTQNTSSLKFSEIKSDPRFDAYGTLITKGGHNHKVSFADDFHKTIVEVSEFQDSKKEIDFQTNFTFKYSKQNISNHFNQIKSLKPFIGLNQNCIACNIKKKKREDLFRKTYMEDGSDSVKCKACKIF